MRVLCGTFFIIFQRISSSCRYNKLTAECSVSHDQTKGEKGSFQDPRPRATVIQQHITAMNMFTRESWFC